MRNILERLRIVPALIGGGYLLGLLLLTIPWIQTHVLYMHALRLPLFSKLDVPEKFGLAPGKTLPFTIPTPDNKTLGAWLVLSDATYTALPFPPPSTPSPSTIKDALHSHPTILFLHGNVGTRAFHRRVQIYTLLTARLQANVLAIDYRGFGDSSGVPTEAGLVVDARAAYEWLFARNGGRGDQIWVMGHSLGTGVGVRMVAELEADWKDATVEAGKAVGGLVLLSPFMSIERLLETYSVFGWFPVLKPLAVFPKASAFLMRWLVHKFDSSAILSKVKAPIMIVHSIDDWDIPHTHSDELFEMLLDPLLPPVPALPYGPITWTNEQWASFQLPYAVRKEARRTLLGTMSLENFGDLQYFERSYGIKESVLVLLKTREGGHDRIGLQEGVHDVIRWMMNYVG